MKHVSIILQAYMLAKAKLSILLLFKKRIQVRGSLSAALLSIVQPTLMHQPVAVQKISLSVDFENLRAG